MKAIRLCALLIVMVSWAVLPALAQSALWTNSAGGNWSVIGNWKPNAVPGSSTAVFLTNNPASSYYTTNDIASESIASLAMSNTSAGLAWVVLGASGFNVSGDLMLVTNSGFIGNGYGSTVGGALKVGSGCRLYHINKDSMQVGATGQGSVTNAGLIVLNAGGSLLCGDVINSGTIQPYTGTGSIAGVVRNLSTISLSNNNAVLNLGGIDPASANTSGTTITNLPGAKIQIGLAGVSGAGGTIHANTNGLGLLNQGLLSVPANAPSGVQAWFDAAVLNDTNGSITLGTGSNMVTFTSFATNKGTISVTLGSYNASFAVQNSNFVNQGVISLNGKLDFKVPGFLINYSNLTWSLSGGAGQLGGGSGIINQPGATFSFTNGAGQGVAYHHNFGNVLTNSGTMILTRTLAESGIPAEFFQVASSIYNNGFIQVLGVGNTLLSGSQILSFIYPVVNNDIGGVIDVTNGAVFDLQGSLQNSGTVRVETNSVFSYGATISPANSLGRMTVGTSNFVNNGTVDLRGGYFAANSFSNAPGSLLQGAGEFGLVTISNVSAVATIFVLPRDIVNSGTLSPSGPFNAGSISNRSGGVIIGSGVIQSLNTTNTGASMTSADTGKKIYNAAGATLLADGGPLVLGNGFNDNTQYGTIGATNGGLLRLGDGSQSLTNRGTIWLSNGQLVCGNLTVTNGSVAIDLNHLATKTAGLVQATNLTLTATSTLTLTGGGQNTVLMRYTGTRTGVFGSATVPVGYRISYGLASDGVVSLVSNGGTLLLIK